MKKVFLFLAILFMGFTSPTWAQSKADKAAHGVKKGTVKAWQGTKKGATKAWQGTKKGAVKAKAHVKDNKSEVWIGPQGQTIYVTTDNRYYWINGNGKRIYVSESALRARNKQR